MKPRMAGVFGHGPRRLFQEAAVLQHGSLEATLGAAQNLVVVSGICRPHHQVAAGTSIEAEEAVFVPSVSAPTRVQAGCDALLPQHFNQGFVEGVVEHLWVAAPGMAPWHGDGIGHVAAVDDGSTAAGPPDDGEPGDPRKRLRIAEPLKATQ